MNYWEEKFIEKKVKRRKRAGLILGSFSVISIILSVLAIVFLIIVINFSGKGLGSYDPFVSVGSSWVIIIAIVGIVILSPIGVLSILKFIAGVMMHKGRGKGFIITILAISMFFSMMLFLISCLMLLVVISISSMTFIVFSILDLSIWSYLIYVLATSGDSFVKKKTKSINVA